MKGNLPLGELVKAKRNMRIAYLAQVRHEEGRKTQYDQ